MKENQKTESGLRHWLRCLVRFHFYDGGGWVRLFGHGLSIQDKDKHPPLFSERNAYRKVFRLGKWGFEFLKANAERSHPTNEG